MVEIKAMSMPEIFTNGKSQEVFWDDPHISKQMLKAHLNHTIDAASRKNETIQASLKWLMSYFDLKGKNLIDLGCGPGLYTSELSRNGVHVTGVDYSKNSIEYAKNEADKSQLAIEYIYQDYLSLNLEKSFDVAMMIYCDFGVLSEENRSQLLKTVYKHLKPKGYFVFDVWTNKNPDLTSEYKNWNIMEKGGFWRPHGYYELVNKRFIEERQVSLRQHMIIDHMQQVYHLWEQCYSRESITELLEAHDFEVVDIIGDVTGLPYNAQSPSLAVIARRK